MVVVMEILFYVLLPFSILHFVVSVYNFFTAPRLTRQIFSEKSNGFISIMVPCRNESANISVIVRSLQAQSYKNAEILFLDDNSTDDTLAILQTELANTGLEAKIINGKPLPEGWLGKNWACHQMAQEAQGEYLLFLDADVRPSTNLVAKLISVFEHFSVDMVSVFPKQIVPNQFSLMLVPMMNWILLNFLPLRMVFQSKKSSFSAANGQCIAFKKSAYNRINGHQSVKKEVVEDMGLIREIKRNGLRGITLLGGEDISCNMYNSFRESFLGFSKNFYVGFGMPIPGFILFLFYLLAVFWLPLALVFVNPLFGVLIILTMLGRGLVAFTAGDSLLFSQLFHVFQMPIIILLGVFSYTRFKQKRIQWKSRIIH